MAVHDIIVEESYVDLGQRELVLTETVKKEVLADFANLKESKGAKCNLLGITHTNRTNSSPVTIPRN